MYRSSFSNKGTRRVSRMFSAQLSGTISPLRYRTSTRRLLQQVLRSWRAPVLRDYWRHLYLKMILTKGPLCPSSGAWPPCFSREVYTYMYIINKTYPVLFRRLSGSADGARRATWVRKVRYRGKAGVGCGMCEGKVKMEGLKSINRKSPHPRGRLGVIAPCARSRETKGLDDKVQGRRVLERRKDPKPQRRLMLFDSRIQDKLRAEHPRARARTPSIDHGIAVSRVHISSVLMAWLQTVRLKW